MMRMLLPILLLILGLGAGGGAGWFLRPAAQAAEGAAAHGAAPGADSAAAAEAGHGNSGDGGYVPASGPTETVRLPNSFVVPVLEDGRVQAMVVVGLALELSVGHGFDVSRDEARLRAVLLQLLFDHANIGGFSGVFTSGEALLALRRILREAARRELGNLVQDVLITELLRQES